MFKWLAKMFTPSVKIAEKEAKVIQKTVSKTVAPKIEPVITEVKKDLPIPAGKIKKIVKEVKVKTEKVTKASLSKLTKVKLEEFALATYGVDIDRRKKKDELVKEVLKLSKKV
jgi:BMFP domain-containing protein YqiC